MRKVGFKDDNAGLAPISNIQGQFLIGYATAPNDVAEDGAGSNSPYAKHLKDVIVQPNLSIEAAFKEVTRKVFDETKGRQNPWLSHSLRDDFQFIESSVTPVITQVKKQLLRVDSSPRGADVSLNGGLVGVTPFERQVEAGEYQITISLAGYQIYTETVYISNSKDIGAAEAGQVFANLIPLEKKGLVTVSSSPSGADVYINDSFVGRTPINNYSLAVGNYSLKVILAGYKEINEGVQVVEGRVNRNFALTANALDGTTPITSNKNWQPVRKEFTEGTATTMVLVPRGNFMMGSENGDPDEKPVHRQSIEKPYWIDETEVTREAYGRCVTAGVCSSTPNSEYSTRANQPINRVTWYQAAKYCSWRGARLPTEVEWEYAARGPDNLVYPWGNEFEGNKVHGNHNSGNETANVGNYPSGASWVGALDMSGNVWGWTSSLKKDYPYINDSDRNLTGSEDNVSESMALRGGSFFGSTDYLRAANRNGDSAGVDYNNVGFRCARSTSGF